jgi:O-antigen/teichoic acid export membrane protein
MDEVKKESNFAEKFIKKMIGFSIPTWISFGLSFLSTPITTRLFMPEEIGKINLFTTYLSLFMSIVLLGLDQSFVRLFNEPPGKNTKESLFEICLRISAFTGIVVGIGIIIFNTGISLAITDSVNIVIAICLAVSLSMNVYLRFSGLYYRMENNILFYSIQTISLTVIGKLSYILVALWSPTHQNAIVVMTIGYVIIASLFVFIQQRGKQHDMIYVDKESLREIFSFGLPLMPVTLLSWLNNSLAQLLLKTYVDFSAIGIYTNAVAVANIISLLQAGFNTYWTPFVYENYKTSKEQIQKIHYFITFAMTAFGILIILGQDIIYLLIGENFRESKIFFPLLLISPICYTIAETTGLGINISKKSYLNTITFVVNVSINILLCFTLLPKYGLIGAAMAAAVSSVVMLIIKTILGEKHYKCITNYYKTFSAIIIIVMVAFVNIWLFNQPILKYSSILMLLIILCNIYKQEVLSIYQFSIQTINKVTKR